MSPSLLWGEAGGDGGRRCPLQESWCFQCHALCANSTIHRRKWRPSKKKCWKNKRKTRNFCTRYRKHWKKPYQTLRISAPPLFSVRVQSAVWAPFKNTKNFLLKWLESLPEKVNHNYDTAWAGRVELKLTFLRNRYQERSKRTFSWTLGAAKKSKNTGGWVRCNSVFRNTSAKRNRFCYVLLIDLLRFAPLVSL